MELNVAFWQFDCLSTDKQWLLSKQIIALRVNLNVMPQQFKVHTKEVGKFFHNSNCIG